MLQRTVKHPGPKIPIACLRTVALLFSQAAPTDLFLEGSEGPHSGRGPWRHQLGECNGAGDGSMSLPFLLKGRYGQDCQVPAAAMIFAFDGIKRPGKDKKSAVPFG